MSCSKRPRCCAHTFTPSLTSLWAAGKQTLADCPFTLNYVLGENTKPLQMENVVLVSSCHCASPEEPPAAIAASELTQTSILYIMHLYNLLDFICIGVSHSNEKSPELTVTIPDVAPRGSIKRAAVYSLNSLAWLHDARCSNHAATSFFFFFFYYYHIFLFLSGWDGDRLRESQE